MSTLKLEDLQLIIRKIKPNDLEAVLKIFNEVISDGDTYAIPSDITKEEAISLWIERPAATYVAEIDNEIVGTYYIKPNQMKPADHVCNCGYMVSSKARGKGVANLMCKNSQDQALQLGFKAMQFNLVVSTNDVAVKLWQKNGFEIVGTLPKAYNHSRLGFVDAYVMYKWL